MVDIIIPLGTGSKSDNDELRLLLRSIEKNGSGYRRIIVVATEIPSWLQNAVTLQMPDSLHQNKDGNIIRKVLFALFVFRTEITNCEIPAITEGHCHTQKCRGAFRGCRDGDFRAICFVIIGQIEILE